MENILPAPVFFFSCDGRMKKMLPDVKRGPLGPRSASGKMKNILPVQDFFFLVC
jgi:hypothetical protein